MACASPILHGDESFALQLQLEEIEAQRELQTGKWNEDDPPDFVLAFDDFEAELQRAILSVGDMKLAHSIASAVDSDAAIIGELMAEETQSIGDRAFAGSLDDQTILSRDVADSIGVFHTGTESVDWGYVLRGSEASTFSIASSSIVAGLSALYAQHQGAVLEQLRQLKVDCVVCRDSLHPLATVRLACDDIYCKPCLKSFFMRASKDESMFPPRCHHQPIDISTIEADFSAEELAAYRIAEQEFTSRDKIYCANPECAKFIVSSQRTPDHAVCEACSARTCMHCKSLGHKGPCPSDQARQKLVDFGREQGWKTCVGCGEMVYRYEGCNHMT